MCRYFRKVRACNLHLNRHRLDKRPSTLTIGFRNCETHVNHCITVYIQGENDA